MIKIHYFFSSKNCKSFKKFVICLKYLLTKIKVKKKFHNTKVKQSFFSILKSPHVNKKAQDQFGHKRYVSNVTLYANNPKKLLIIIKKLRSRLFTDVKAKIKVSINEKYSKQACLKVFNPSNFKLNLYDKILKTKLKNNLKLKLKKNF